MIVTGEKVVLWKAAMLAMKPPPGTPLPVADDGP